MTFPTIEGIAFDPKVFEEDFFKKGVLDDKFFEEVAKRRARETPNFNFELDQLQVFWPGRSREEIDQSLPENHPAPEKLMGDLGDSLVRYALFHERYSFPVYVQYKDGVATDFLARLPPYFLHDVFHQSLINRYGRQDRYFRKEEHAIYQWNNIEANQGVRLTYSGACTLTCFPLYLSVAAGNLADNVRSIPELLDSATRFE